MKYKKIFLSVLSAFAVPAILFSHSADLPKPGLTPEDNLYFFEELMEGVQEFFTFGNDAKARLHAAFVLERVAEVERMLEEGGVEAEGIPVAEERLKNHLAAAVHFALKKTESGEDTEELLSEINRGIDESKDALKEIFEDKKDGIESQIEDIKKKLEDAKKSGDANATVAFSEELASLKT